MVRSGHLKEKQRHKGTRATAESFGEFAEEKEK